MEVFTIRHPYETFPGRWRAAPSAGSPDTPGSFDLRHDLTEMFRRRPIDVFVIKASWWIGR
jgi:hypothetical protein